MKKNIFTQLLIFLILVLSFSCTSLQQDVMISSVDAENIEEFQEIESQVALLDASFCLGEKNAVTTKLTEDTVKQIDILLLESGLEKEAQSRLWALKGIIFFTEGKKIKASECFDFANDLYKGEVFTMILGSRLELVKLTEDEKAKLSAAMSVAEYQQRYEAVPSGQLNEFGLPTLSVEHYSPEEIAAEQLAAERRVFMDDYNRRVWDGKVSDAVLAEKAFYEGVGRPMTRAEMESFGLPMLPPETTGNAEDYTAAAMASEPKKDTIFDATYNSIAARYTNPKTGTAYENMDELIANDPALLSSILEFVEVTPSEQRQQYFSNVEAEHLKQLQKYQADLDAETVEHLFRTYADENAVEEDRLEGAIRYIIESGLTLEDKSRLGLLWGDAQGQREYAAERTQRIMGEHGNETMRVAAISLLGEDAPEHALQAVQAGMSHLWALETGVAVPALQAYSHCASVGRSNLYPAGSLPAYFSLSLLQNSLASFQLTCSTGRLSPL